MKQADYNKVLVARELTKITFIICLSAIAKVDWVKKLSQKAYNVSGDVSYLQKTQSAIKNAPLQSLASSIDEGE